MTQLSERTLVHAPLASAKDLVNGVFRAQTPTGAKHAHFVLHAGDAKQAAMVDASLVHRAGDMTPRYAIRWSAENDGPFPIFDGQLIVQADEVYEMFWLALDGSYAPPGGAAGLLFDAVAGRHIAAATARAFLEHLRNHIEMTFTDSERSKAVRAGRS
jgi:hypothetical protein